MVETIKTLANIAFFAIVSLVTVLSYLHARKTLFAPIRTETFKLQLKAFEEILLYFQNKSESDFLEAMDLNRIVALNAMQMADDYVHRFFAKEITIDEDERKKQMEPLIGAVISKEHMLKAFEMADGDTPIVKLQSTDKTVTNPALILANWQKYEYGKIDFTKEYQDQVKELDRLAASPLLPKPLREHLSEFRKVQTKNLTLAGKVITECAQRMPEHFPNASNLEEFDVVWVWNEYNQNRKSFEPVAKKILEYINDYLKIEELMS